MEFTFGVLTYNSEQTVIETLESVKYQISNYGQKKEFYLVIADDCSKDNTLKLIKRWIDANNKLFKHILVLESKENQGVCKNYSKMIKAIKTRDFIQIAGDDVICSHNIFDKICNLDENEIRVFMQYDLINKDVIINDFYIARQLYYKNSKHNNDLDRRLLETFPPYRSIEVVFQRKYYTDGCLSYLEKYHNFEDDTSLYYIFLHNKNVRFTFSTEPLILYRRANYSLTQAVDTPSQMQFLVDLYKFRRDTFKNEKNIFTKFLLALSVYMHFLMVHRFKYTKTLFWKLTINNKNKIIKKMMKQNNFSSLKQECFDFISKENEYINKIVDNSKVYLINNNEMDKMFK